MKAIFIMLVIAMTFTTYAQESTTDPTLSFGKEIEKPAKKKDEKRGSDIYGSLYGMVDVKAGKIGGGIYVGYAPVPVFGFGLVADAISIEGINSGNKAGISTMGEVRVFPQVPFIWPSLAFQGGLFNYSDKFVLNGPRSLSQVTVDGKTQIGGNINFRFGNKPNAAGLSLGYSFRSVKFETDSRITIINSNGSTSKTSSNDQYTGEYHLITLGIRF